MVSVSGTNNNNDDKKVILKPQQKTEVQNTEPVFSAAKFDTVSNPDDFNIPGFTVTKTITPAQIYEKKYNEIHDKIAYKESHGERVSDEEYNLMTKYDLLVEYCINNKVDKILTREEEQAAFQAEKQKIENENPYWNDYCKAKIELMNYEKNSPDRTSAQYKEIYNKWQYFENMVCKHGNIESIEEYEKSHPVTGEVTTEERNVNINKDSSFQTGDFTFNGNVNGNLSINDLSNPGEGNLSSNSGGSISYNKNNFSVNSNVNISLNSLTEKEIQPSYNMSAGASYNLKGVNLTGQITKNIDNNSNLLTKQISAGKQFSNFYAAASHTQNSQSGLESYSQNTSTANLQYQGNKFSVEGSYSFIETQSNYYSELAQTVSIGGQYEHKNMTYNLNSDLTMKNGETIPSFTGSINYAKKNFSAGVRSTISEESRNFSANVAYTKKDFKISGNVECQNGQKPGGSVSISAKF